MHAGYPKEIKEYIDQHPEAKGADLMKRFHMTKEELASLYAWLMLSGEYQLTL
jgi:hypothetical protein